VEINLVRRVCFGCVFQSNIVIRVIDSVAYSTESSRNEQY
jgi:hypothetical protein